MTSYYDEASKTNRRSKMWDDEKYSPGKDLAETFLIIGTIFNGVLFLACLFVFSKPLVLVPGLTFCLGLATIWWFGRSRPTGNIAFDQHVEDTVEALGKEKREFIRFLRDENAAEDKAAFARFMERNK
jgi:hypothetical protein